MAETNTSTETTTPPAADATDKLARELIEAMPAASVEPETAAMFDDIPRVEKKPDGKPNLKKDGTGVRQARGNKPKPKPVATETQSQAPEVKQAEVVDVRAVAHNSAVVVVETMRMCGSFIGGDEWEFTTVDLPNGQKFSERDNLVNAWEEYFVATGSPNLPPWVVPTVATLSYVGVRVSRPKTRSALSTLWQRVRLWFGGLKLRISGAGGGN